MGQSKRKVGMEMINQQIEVAQEKVVQAKKKYDEATERLKSLLEKKKALQSEELMAAIMKSSRSYEDILRYIQTEPSEQED